MGSGYPQIKLVLACAVMLLISACTGFERGLSITNPSNEAPLSPGSPSDEPPKEPGDQQPTEPGKDSPEAIGFSDGYDKYGLLGNENFDPENPTLKDGTPLTGEMLRYYNAALYWITDKSARTGDWVYVDIVNRFSHNDTYQSARNGQTLQSSMLQIFRLTGDLRILDRLVEGYNASKLRQTVRWKDHRCSLLDERSVMTCCGNLDPWSPYAKWLDYQGSFEYGTDLLYLNVNKLATIQAEYAWALHLNRGKRSPAGYNYSREADYWADVVVQFLKSWSEPVTDCWTNNYRGDQWNNGSSGRRRAPWGTYPVVYREGSHTAMQTIPHHRYLGLLGLHGSGVAKEIPNPEGALNWAKFAAQRMRERAFVSCTSSLGPSFVHPRGGWFKNPADYSLFATYTNYIALMNIQLWMTGDYRDIVTREDLKRLSRAYVDMHNSDGTTKKNMNADVAKCGLKATEGSGRSVRQQSINGFATMLVFEDHSESTKLKEAAIRVQQSDSGGWETPRSGILASALFVREALEKLNDL